MLHEFISTNAQTILDRTRMKVAARLPSSPPEAELKHGVQLFLTQLIERLRDTTVDGVAIAESATLHGGELLAQGFTLSQVVHGYGDVCQAVTQLADEKHSSIAADEFQLFNRCLDDAIANSVTEYQRQRDQAVAHQGTERLGILAQELRSRLSAATLAYTMLLEGTVAIGGSTGSLLGRSLRGLRVLINTSLASLRIEAGKGERTRVAVAELLREAEDESSLEAVQGGHQFVVSPFDPAIEVAVDVPILAAALANLLQNAFVFGRPEGKVSLRASATATRVRIEVEDECGGLAPGKVDEMFQAAEGKGPKGLGLSLSRRGVKAMEGSLEVRDLPGRGCLFSIDLPRWLA